MSNRYEAAGSGLWDTDGALFGLVHTLYVALVWALDVLSVVMLLVALALVVGMLLWLGRGGRSADGDRS